MFFAKNENETILLSDVYKTDYVQVFEDKDMGKIREISKEIEKFWNKITSEYVIKNGDGGTCVLGAGIEILHIPKKTKKLRKLKRKLIINQPTCCQGSLNWEGERLARVIALLKEQGILNPRYNQGFMD